MTIFSCSRNETFTGSFIGIFHKWLKRCMYSWGFERRTQFFCKITTLDLSCVVTVEISQNFVAGLLKIYELYRFRSLNLSKLFEVCLYMYHMIGHLWSFFIQSVYSYWTKLKNYIFFVSQTKKLINRPTVSYMSLIIFGSLSYVQRCRC